MRNPDPDGAGAGNFTPPPSYSQINVGAKDFDPVGANDGDFYYNPNAVSMRVYDYSSTSWINVPGVKSAAGTPSSAPYFRGQSYLDTTAGRMYFSTGTTSSSDWSGIAALNISNTYSSTQTITPTTGTPALQVNPSASGVGLVVKSNTVTPGNIAQFQDSSSNVVTRIVSGGGIVAVEPIITATGPSTNGTLTLDASTGTTFTVTFGTANITGLLFTNLPNAGSVTLTLILKQDATAGSRTITWSGTQINGSSTNATPKWAGGTAPTLSTATNAVDIITLVVNRTGGATDNVYGFSSGKDMK